MDLISDHPFWPINSGLIRSYPSLKADLQCEVLVIGAGITGALCAHHLAKAGMDVAVLDKRDVAGGSTSASTAMLQYEIDTPLTELTGRMVYMRTTVDGRVIVGGEDAGYRNPLRRDAAIGSKAAKLEKRFREMFPDIDMQPAYAWAGTFGETKDGLAYIDNVPECRRCFFTLGFGGNGITYSVIAAEIVRDAIQGKTHPDAHLFRFDR
jgi:glycine/D-amino acid oxidase-like deaminating enzyme